MKLSEAILMSAGKYPKARHAYIEEHENGEIKCCVLGGVWLMFHDISEINKYPLVGQTNMVPDELKRQFNCLYDARILGKIVNMNDDPTHEYTPEDIAAWLAEKGY